MDDACLLSEKCPKGCSPADIAGVSCHSRRWRGSWGTHLRALLLEKKQAGLLALFAAVLSNERPEHGRA